MGIFNSLQKKKSLEDTEDVEKDMRLIMEFFTYTAKDMKDVYDRLIKAKRLHAKERAELNSKKQIKLLEEEIAAWDAFLERFVWYYRDVALAGQRVKRVSKVLREESRKLPVHKKTKNTTHKKDEWVFNW